MFIIFRARGLNLAFILITSFKIRLNLIHRTCDSIRLTNLLSVRVHICIQLLRLAIHILFASSHIEVFPLVLLKNFFAVGLVDALDQFVNWLGVGAGRFVELLHHSLSPTHPKPILFPCTAHSTSIQKLLLLISSIPDISPRRFLEATSTTLTLSKPPKFPNSILPFPHFILTNFKRSVIKNNEK